MPSYSPKTSRVWRIDHASLPKTSRVWRIVSGLFPTLEPKTSRLWRIVAVIFALSHPKTSQLWRIDHASLPKTSRVWRIDCDLLPKTSWLWRIVFARQAQDYAGWIWEWINLQGYAIFTSLHTVRIVIHDE